MSMLSFATRSGVPALMTLNPAWVNKFVVSAARSRRIAVQPPSILVTTIAATATPIANRGSIGRPPLADPTVPSLVNANAVGDRNPLHHCMKDFTDTTPETERATASNCWAFWGEPTTPTSIT
jgi:hypothetical protein